MQKLLEFIAFLIIIAEMVLGIGISSGQPGIF
jgi:hypothetical protein